ncbi:hypothetical protein CRT60_09925 [Azospirillum palustre]|uniref:Uncharacterized protein n=1 Tax=Azospirillum palustre TaxID=2044885 RepID=A0A2B8BKI6_9PROT|nr:hypothetical protein [Azospirillum palustre]PGH58239.1 hypothetical protein CRT60_09925 [Azospirillum palustre]
MREPQQKTALDADTTKILDVYGRMTAEQQPHFLNLIRGLTDDDWPLVERSLVALNKEEHLPKFHAILKVEG